MDFGSVKSFSIDGRDVSFLLINGKVVWRKAEPGPTPAGVPYVETDGVASYFDLGFTPTANMTYEVVAKPVKHESEGYDEFHGFLFGAWVSRRMAYCAQIGTGGVTFSYPSAQVLVEDMESSFTMSFDGIAISVNGSPLETTGVGTRAGSTTMKIANGAGENAGRKTDFCKARFYSAKFWESGVLIRDLVPYSGPRGVGLLDKVNDVLYTNAGGGEVVYGEEMPYDYEIEYVESDGSASFVDLGFTPTVDCDIEFGMYYLGHEDTSFCGANSSRSLNMFNFGFSDAGLFWSNICPQDGLHDYGLERGMHTFSIKGNVCSVDGEQFTSGSKNPGRVNLQLFADPYYGPLGRMRCSYFKAWESGELVRDMVPVVKNGKAGFWDKVGEKFYGNAADAGELIPGPKIGVVPYVMTKGQSDSFWAYKLEDLGLYVPTEAKQFAFEVDMWFPEEFYSDGSGVFGFVKANSFYAQNMQSISAGMPNEVSAFVPGSVVTTSGTSINVGAEVRNLVSFGHVPGSRQYASVNGSTVRKISTSSLKIPMAGSFRFGGNSTATSGVVESVIRPVVMKVYGINIVQDGKHVAELVPYKDGEEVGMMNRLDGRKYPGSNVEYGEEA